MRKFALFASLGLLASATVAWAQDFTAAPAEAWTIGPVIRGKNYSVGMPLQPDRARRGWSFEFPHPSVGAGHVHYVTLETGPLAGKRRIVMRYRIDAARGARFVPREHPELPATVSLFFQRHGDSWSGKRHPHHRWWSPAGAMRELAPGEHEIVVSLRDGNWISVWGGPASSHPEAFDAALEETARVGLVFGSSAARGHGVYSTAPARFTLLSYRVE